MATIDRFKDALASGIALSDSEKKIPLTAQMKYDYLAAVHTMDQLMNLYDEFQARKKRRDTFRERISTACKVPLRKIVESDGVLTIKQINEAMKILKDCHDELLKMEAIANECEKLEKFIADGVSAGH